MRGTSGQFARKAVTSVAAQFLTLAGSMVAAILTARVLGAQGRGELSLLLLVPLLATSLGKLGIGHAVNYFTTKRSRTELIISSFALSIAISVALVVLTAAAAVMLDERVFGGIDHQLLAAAVLAIPIFVLSSHSTSLLQAFYRIEVCNFLLVIQSLGNVLLLVLLLPKLGLYGAVIASFGSYAATLVIACVWLAKDIQIAKVGISVPLIRDLLRFGIRSHVGNVLKDLSYRIDIFIIGFFLSATDVGYYVVALTVAEILWKIPDAVGGVLLPRVARLTRDEARLFTPMIIRLVLVPVAIGCVVMFVFSKDIVSLIFGAAFLPAAPLLTILLPGVLAMAVWKLLANDLIAQGHPGKYSATSAISLLTLVVASVSLVPAMGVQGAALASSISYAAATVSILYVYMRVTRVSLVEMLVPARRDLAALKAIKWR